MPSLSQIVFALMAVFAAVLISVLFIRSLRKSTAPVAAKPPKEKCPECRGDGHRHHYVSENDTYIRYQCRACKGSGYVLYYGRFCHQDVTRETSQRLLDILQNHCGERGDNEGATETLARIVRERDNLIEEFVNG